VRPTLNVEVDVDNAKSVLRPGAYVFVHFRLRAFQNAFAIPFNAQLLRAEGAGVVRDNRVELSSVTIGRDFGNYVDVSKTNLASRSPMKRPSTRPILLFFRENDPALLCSVEENKGSCR
jgi:hypothetical protein